MGELIPAFISQGSCEPGTLLLPVRGDAADPLPAGAAHTGGALVVAEHSVKRLSALRLMLFLHMFTEKMPVATSEITTRGMWLRSPISMLVRAPAGWIAGLHSSLTWIFTSMNFSSFGEILHRGAVCPGLGEGESDCLGLCCR